jgi:hypothetical protein
MGTDIPERRVRPSAVGAHLDVSDHIVARLLTRGVIMVRRPRTCSTATAWLGHRMVEPRALTTQTTADSMVCQQVLIRVTGLLTAAIRMMQQTCCGMTTSPRHPQRVLHHSCRDPTTHRPTHHLKGRHVEPRRHRPPALPRPPRAAIASPHVIGLGHGKRAREQVRRHLIALSTVRGDRTAPRGTRHRHPCLVHHPSRLRSSHGEPRVLEWCGPAATARTVTCAGRKRLDTGSQGDCLRIDLSARLARQVVINATAADLEPRTAQRHRPETLMLGATGISPLDSLAPSPSAVFHTARSLRRRVCAWRHRCHASCASETRPFPGHAAGC